MSSDKIIIKPPIQTYYQISQPVANDPRPRIHPENLDQQYIQSEENSSYYRLKTNGGGYLSVNNAYEDQLMKTEPKRPCWGGTSSILKNNMEENSCSIFQKPENPQPTESFGSFSLGSAIRSGRHYPPGYYPSVT